MGPSQGSWNLKGDFRKLLPIIPLNSQGETKLKISEKILPQFW